MSNDIADKDKSILIPHTFNQTQIVEIEYQGKPVFLAQQVGEALGYADPSKLSKNITEKWSADFEEGRDFLKLTNGTLADFKAAVNCVPDRDPVDSDYSPIRGAVVDPRTPNLILVTEAGAQLAAILSRTEQSRAFRRWLIDVVLPAYHARHTPPPPSRPPAEPRTQRRQPKALPGAQNLSDLTWKLNREEREVYRFDKEGVLLPRAEVRDHLIGRLMSIARDQSAWRPALWRRQMIEGIAHRFGLALATFEGDPDLQRVIEADQILDAQARDLFDRMTDFQLVWALAAAAEQTGILHLLDSSRLRTEGWRWTPGRDPAEELARLRQELARANQELTRLSPLQRQK